MRGKKSLDAYMSQRDRLSKHDDRYTRMRGERETCARLRDVRPVFAVLAFASIPLLFFHRPFARPSLTAPLASSNDEKRVLTRDKHEMHETSG